MHFDRYGHTYQLRIRTPDELAEVVELDDTLWTALSAPVTGLHCDREFLGFVDLDSNGRIRADEVRAAVRYLLKRLSDPSQIAEGTDVLRLSMIDTSHTEGRRLVETAQYILGAIGEGGQEHISLDHLKGFRDAVGKSVINGDGIITPIASDDEDTREFIADVVSCVEGRSDLTGRKGITEEDLAWFLDAAGDYVAWVEESDLSADGQATGVMPLGEGTCAAYDAFATVKDKVDEFFDRCSLLRFWPEADAQARAALLEQLHDRSAHGPSVRDRLAAGPLAEPNADGVLPLQTGLNPAYVAGMNTFTELVVQPLLGKDTELSEADWLHVTTVFAPRVDWMARKPATDVGKLGRDKLRRYLDGPYAKAVQALIARDKEVALRLVEARELKKLVLFHKYLLPLANNFVSFPDLYNPERRALFEMGSLVIDSRWFSLAVKVKDIEEHCRLAKTSGMFVMYVELTHRGEPSGLMVAVPATSGTVGNLCVGKRGVFYDTTGKHYDARILRIIKNPISFREAAVAPFVRLGHFIAGKIEAISGSAQKELEGRVGLVTESVRTGVAETIREGPQGGGASAPQSGGDGGFGAQGGTSRRDLILGASVSVAALSSAFAFVTSRLTDALEHPGRLAGALAVIILVVLVPTALAAAIKLARRDLSAILEGCGWAINGRMHLSRQQRHQFTRFDGFPKDATGTPGRRWALIVLLVILLGLIIAGVVKFWPSCGPASGPPIETPGPAIPGP